MIQQHYVEFYSPGTFVSESTRKEIDSWDTEKAKAMAKEIVERHGARPYAFRFITRGRGPNDLDAKVINQSGLFYFGCDDDRILISNMENNNITRIAVPRNGWKGHYPIGDKDVVL